MAVNNPSVKKIQIDKDSKTMIIWASIAIFIVVFCLVSTKSLYSVFSLQNKVISANNNSINRLSRDKSSVSQLIGSYKNFVNTSTNIIGGSTSSDTQNNGDNAKIILDALPSSYDYPALLSSIQNILSSQGVVIGNISGSPSQQGGSSSSSGQTTSSPIPMTFSFSVTGPYQNIQNVVNEFELSIRPMQFQTIDLSGNQNSMTLNASVQTYYQPSIGFNITKENIN